MTRRVLEPLAMVTLVALMAGCRDNVAPGVRGVSRDTLPGLVVSQPLARLAPSGSAGRVFRAAPGGASAVFVSLVPGTVATGVQATISDLATGASVTARMVDGGFDPVPIGAAVGDTLLVSITRIDAGPIQVWATVRGRHPPVVIRTSPPPGGKDVPLNAVMIVVFSDPLDSSVVSGGHVRLLRDTTPLAGSAVFGDSNQLIVAFQPAGPLAPLTAYHLVVDSTIQGLSGLPVAAAVDAPFTTGPGGSAFTTVSAGGDHTCGVTGTDEVYCWGLNDHGQLGDGTTVTRTTPVRVAGGIPLVTLIAGGSHTCGLTVDNHAYCWGANDHGQLGDGTTTDRYTPVAVAGDLTFSMGFVAGDRHTCGMAATADPDVGAVYCWGANASGQVGDGTTTDRLQPTAIDAGVGRFAENLLSAGGEHTCALDRWNLGLDYCWGSNSHGQLDDGTTVDRSAPTLIIQLPCLGQGPTGMSCPSDAITPFATITGGAAHTCAEAGGFNYYSFQWYCWGANESGELGDGTTTDRSSPVLVNGAMTFQPYGVVAGGRHTCGLAGAPSQVLCWGANDHGQLGDGTTANRSLPAVVAGGLTYTGLTAGGNHTCAITPTGAYCWGANAYGQLGNGTRTDSSVPVKVAGQP